MSIHRKIIAISSTLACCAEWVYSDGNNDRSSVMTDRFCSLSGQKIFEDIKMTGTFVKNYIVCFIFSSVARMYYQRYLIAINKQSFIKYHLDLFIHF